MVNKIYSLMQFQAFVLKLLTQTPFRKNFWAYVYMSPQKKMQKKGEKLEKKTLPTENLGGKLQLHK